MSLTYGYNLKDRQNARSADSGRQTTVTTRPTWSSAYKSPPILCGFNFVSVKQVVPHGYFQCGTFLHGSHTSVTNHWQE